LPLLAKEGRAGRNFRTFCWGLWHNLRVILGLFLVFASFLSLGRKDLQTSGEAKRLRKKARAGRGLETKWETSDKGSNTRAKD
jgi:hypothetical protein